VLPPVAACKNEQLVINNGGAKTAVLNADLGSDIIPAGSTMGVSSFSLSPGQTATLVSDGTNWNVMGSSMSALASAVPIKLADEMVTSTISATLSSSAGAATPFTLLQTAAPSFTSPQPFDHTAEFVGTLDSTKYVPLIDNLMSQHAGDRGLDLGHWAVSAISQSSRKSSVCSPSLAGSGVEAATISHPLASLSDELLDMLVLPAGARLGRA
jgi:hypothetical protein